MLTRLVVRNFKGLEEADIELGQTVVFIGPNNSGKTTALQALALWQSGMGALADQANAPPATINLRSLTHTPVRDAGSLWSDLRVSLPPDREAIGSFRNAVLLHVDVEGQSADTPWRFGVEFLFANPESVYCRPSLVPVVQMQEAARTAMAKEGRIRFLSPMSGITSEEEELRPGRIDVLLGEGQTARVLRNLCLSVQERDTGAWHEIVRRIRHMFGVQLDLPTRDTARGTIRLGYRQRDLLYDIASAGRGMQHILLLLAHMYANPGATLLLDEPDAHLEVLRQREIYNVLTDTARSTGSQLIMASHSEILLAEAADRHLVIGFIGRPHRINDQGGQLKKALTEIGFDQYAQALIKPGVLYLEGPTDLAMLRAFAERLEHPARDVLETPFVHYVGNQPGRALSHYFGLREAKPELRAFALFDRRDNGLRDGFAIPAHCWRRREIENYITTPDVLRRFANDHVAARALAPSEVARREQAMVAAISQVEAAQETLGRDAWGADTKASEEVLPSVFRLFYKGLGLRNEMNKADYHELVAFLSPQHIDPEIVSVLDMIHDNLRESS